MSDDKLRVIVKGMLDKGYSREDIDKVVKEFRSRQQTTGYSGDEVYNAPPEIPEYKHITQSDVETNVGDSWWDQEENASDYFTKFYQDQGLDVRFEQAGVGSNKLKMMVGQEKEDNVEETIDIGKMNYQDIQAHIERKIDSKFNKEKSDKIDQEILTRIENQGFGDIDYNTEDIERLKNLGVTTLKSEDPAFAENILWFDDSGMGRAQYAHSFDKMFNDGVSTAEVWRDKDGNLMDRTTVEDEQKDAEKYGERLTMWDDVPALRWTAEFFTVGQYDQYSGNLSGGINLNIDGEDVYVPHSYIWNHRKTLREKQLKNKNTTLNDDLIANNFDGSEDNFENHLNENSYIYFSDKEQELYHLTNDYKDLQNKHKDILSKETGEGILVKSDDEQAITALDNIGKKHKELVSKLKEIYPGYDDEYYESLLLFDKDGDFINYKKPLESLDGDSEEYKIETDANDLARLNDQEYLTNKRREAYVKLLNLSKISYNNIKKIEDETNIFTKSLGAMFDFSNDALQKDVYQLEQISKTNDLFSLDQVRGVNKTLSMLPGGADLAESYNKALLDYKTLSRAVDLNLDINRTPEENIWIHTLNGLGKSFGGEGIVDSQTEDEARDAFQGILKFDGYDVPDHVMDAEFGGIPKWAGGDGFKFTLGKNTTGRKLAEGSSDVITQLAPLLTELYVFKRVGGLKNLKSAVKGLNTRLTSKITNPYARKVIDKMIVPGVTTAAEWSIAESGGQAILGTRHGDQWKAHTINWETGETNFTMPFVMGMSGPMFAQFSRSASNAFAETSFGRAILPRLQNPESWLRTTKGGRLLNETSTHITKAGGQGATATALLVVAETAQANIDALLKDGKFADAERMKEITDVEHLMSTWLAMTVLSAKDISPKVREQFRSEVANLKRETQKVKDAQEKLGVNDKSSAVEINEATQKQIDKAWENQTSIKEYNENVKKLKEQNKTLRQDLALRNTREAAIKDGQYYRDWVLPRWEKFRVMANKPVEQWTSDEYDMIAEMKHNDLYGVLRDKGINPGTKGFERFESIHESVKYLTKWADVLELGRGSKERTEYMNNTINTEMNSYRIKELKQNIKDGKGTQRDKIELKKLEETQKMLFEKNEGLYDKFQEKWNKMLEAEILSADAIAKKLGTSIQVLNNKQWKKKGFEMGEGFYNPKTKEIFLNLDAIKKTKNLGAPIHEVVHHVLRNSLKDPKTGKISKDGIKIIDGLMERFSLRDQKVIQKRIDENYRYDEVTGKEKAKEDYYEEYITGIGDAIKNKQIKYDQSTMRKIGKVLYPGLKKIMPNLYKYELNGTNSAKASKDLFNMLGDIGTTSKNRALEKSLKELGEQKGPEAKKTVEIVDQAIKKSTSKYKEPTNKIGEKIGKEIKGKKYTTEDALIELYDKNILQDLISLKLKPFEKLPGISYEDMVASTIAESMAHIRGFKPEMKIEGTQFGLYGHIEGQLRNKIGNVLKTGKGATKTKFEEEIGGEKFKDVEADQRTAEEILDAKIAAEAAVESAPNLRKSLVNEKGEPYVKEPIIKEIENAVVKTLGTKLPEVSTKEFKLELQTSFKNFLKKPIADMMGKRGDFDAFLLDGYPAIKRHMPVDFFVKLERLKKPEDRIFTTEEKRLTKQEEIRDAIDKGKLDPNVSETAGNKLYSKKDFSYNDFYNFFRGKDVGASTKGTRKDALAEGMATEFAFDMTMEVARRPDVMQKRSEINNKTNEQAQLEIAEMAKRINRDPNLKFSKDKKLREVKDAALFTLNAQEVIRLLETKGYNKVFDKNGRLRPEYSKFEDQLSTPLLRDLANKDMVNPKLNLAEIDVTQKLLQKIGKTTKTKVSDVIEQIPMEMGRVYGGKYGLKMKTTEITEGGVADWNAELNRVELNIETKAFKHQMPRNKVGTKLNFETGEGWVISESLPPKVRKELVDAIGKVKKGLKEYNDFIIPEMKKLKIEGVDNVVNNTLVPAELITKAQLEGLQAKTTVNVPFENGMQYIAYKYGSKKLSEKLGGAPAPNFYINIASMLKKELGLYKISDYDPFGFGLPKLEVSEGGITLVGRFSAGSSTPVKAPKGYEKFHTPGQKYYRPNWTFIPKIDPFLIKNKSEFALDNKSKFMKFMESDGVKRFRELNPEQTNKINEGIIQKVIGGKYSKSSKKEIINDLRTIDVAKNLGRLAKKERKGMSTWDFDDTLAFTKSGVRYTLPNPSGKPQPKKKVIFMAGGAGSGKSNVIRQLQLEKQGFKIVNQDISLEWLMKNHGLPKDMREFTSEQRSQFGKLGHQARQIAMRKRLKFQGKGDGVIVDGTGASIKSMEKLVKEFRDKGYDAQMVFVETSKDVSVARNKARKERSLKTSIVESTWDKVMGNKEAFKKMFGERFAEVNTDKLKQNDPMPAELISKLDAFTKGYIKDRLNAGEFADRGSKLLEEGAKFDFSEFNVVTQGSPGPFFKKALDRAKKYGTKDQFVLTARPPESARPIHEFLKSQGLNIPLENITGLGNSTAEAKAMWMLKKFEQGYNDMYFADDAIQNVKEVKNVLEQLDVKSKVQQAKFSKNKNLSKEFNEILENKFDVGAHKKYSEAKAKMVGAGKGKFKFWGSPAAEDFSGLVTYAFSGKGKKGEAHKQWFDDALHRPYNRAYNDIHARKQNISNDYKHLRKTMPEVRRRLNDTVDGVYTVEQAIRTHLWDKAGFKVPGLSKTDLRKLTDYVRKDKDLTLFAETLSNITMLKDGYLKPSEHWLGENIIIDLNNVVDRVYRKEALAEFKENREAIFGKWDPKTGRLIGPNMNKIEAIKGPRHREAIENMIWRMENMTNRSRGTDGVTNTWMNWVNNATGTIMFFNQKSAVLQTISTINYTNGTWNNPFRAGKAFANQPQYWKDFSKIWNSDMMVQRRAGLKINVEAAEILDRVSGSKNKASAALSYLLEKGFIPTKYADSFAIASGGATFYRNRIKYYEKQGLKTKEAEAKAWEDFTLFTEKTQQSSRPDLISMQQASALGRPILAFANTPMQMFRRHKRRIQDIANRRGNTAENVASSLYYGAVQTMIFSYLANAMFAVDNDSEDEDDIKHAERQKSRHLHTIVDSYLRGMGLSGAVPSALKNGIVRFTQENKKDFNADYGNVVIDMLNVSPPIGSKARKLYGATKTWKHNKEVIPEMGWDFDNPAVMAVANVISALTNVPADRAVMKAQNIRDASMGDFETWQRIAMFMGINKWNLGVGDKGPGEIEVGDIEAKIKARKKEESKIKAKEKREIKKEKDLELKEAQGVEKQKQEKKAGKQVTCLVCKLPVQKGKKYCTIHEKKEQRSDGKKKRCKKTKSDFTRCKVMTSNKSGYCYYHD
jgi:predicted kinase